jgi:signal transduction histidine kinase
MKTDSIVDKLIIEEIKATKLYLWLFYFIFLSYDLIIYIIIPLFTGREAELVKLGLGYWLYFIVIGLLPISIYFIKSNKSYIVKYFIFFGYNLIDLTNTLMIYVGKELEFASANVVEVLFILFTPIFLSRRFYWIVLSSMILKYALIGVILLDGILIIGIVILLVLAGVSYLYIHRFNSYIKTLEKVHEDLHHKEKLALVGQLATSIGHEIRNPLQALKGFTQLQEEKHQNDQEYYRIMQSELERINVIVNDLMYIGKPKPTSFEENDVENILKYVVRILAPIAEINNVTFQYNFESHKKIECDGNQLKQVFINLIKNSIESMPNGGNITISSKLIEDEKILVLIEDEGCGIEEDKIRDLGKPFFTTKSDGNGLGLMVSFDIIEKHNGKILYKSNIGKGTTVEINLPVKSK